MRAMVRTAVVAALLVFLVSVTRGDANDGVGPVSIVCGGINLENVTITQGSSSTYDLWGIHDDRGPRYLSATIDLSSCMLVP